MQAAAKRRCRASPPASSRTAGRARRSPALAVLAQAGEQGLGPLAAAPEEAGRRRRRAVRAIGRAHRVLLVDGQAAGEVGAGDADDPGHLGGEAGLEADAQGARHHQVLVLRRLPGQRGRPAGARRAGVRAGDQDGHAEQLARRGRRQGRAFEPHEMHHRGQVIAGEAQGEALARELGDGVVMRIGDRLARHLGDLIEPAQVVVAKRGILRPRPLGEGFPDRRPAVEPALQQQLLAQREARGDQGLHGLAQPGGFAPGGLLGQAAADQVAGDLLEAGDAPVLGALRALDGGDAGQDAAVLALGELALLAHGRHQLLELPGLVLAQDHARARGVRRRQVAGGGLAGMAVAPHQDRRHRGRDHQHDGRDDEGAQGPRRGRPPRRGVEAVGGRPRQRHGEGIACAGRAIARCRRVAVVVVVVVVAHGPAALAGMPASVTYHTWITRWGAMASAGSRGSSRIWSEA